jgi:hypothetical protein
VLVEAATIGMTALTLAYKPVAHGDDFANVEDLTMLCIFNLMDQPLPATREFRSVLRQSGMRLILGTATHFTGSLAIGRMFGYGIDICNEEMYIRNDIPKAEAARTAKTISI